MCSGAGLALGPIICSVVYNSLQYEGTMYLFGVIDLIALVVCFTFIPGVFNQDLEEENEEEDEEEEGIKEKKSRRDITWKDILTNKHSNYSIVALLSGMFSIQYFLGFFADELIDLGLPPDRVGYVYGIESMVYFVMMIIFPYLF